MKLIKWSIIVVSIAFIGVVIFSIYTNHNQKGDNVLVYDGGKITIYQEREPESINVEETELFISKLDVSGWREVKIDDKKWVPICYIQIENNEDKIEVFLKDDGENAVVRVGNKHYNIPTDSYEYIISSIKK